MNGRLKDGGSVVKRQQKCSERRTEHLGHQVDRLGVGGRVRDAGLRAARHRQRLSRGGGGHTMRMLQGKAMPSPRVQRAHTAVAVLSP